MLFAFQMFLLIFGWGTSIFSGTLWIHGSTSPLPAVILPHYLFLEKWLPSLREIPANTILRNVRWDLGRLSVHSSYTYKISSKIYTSSWGESAKLLFFTRECSIKNTPEPRWIITILIIITSSLLLCPRSQNPQVGHQKGSILKFLKMFY